MNLKSKKIIAKEGLIALSVITLIWVAYQLGGDPDNLYPSDFESIMAFLYKFLMYSYFIYWVIKFIKWATKVLRTNSE